MLWAEQFQRAVAEAFTSQGATIDLLPMVFARTAVAVLPVEGAGLALIDHLRIPLSATDQDVVTAERLQTTLGEGPCLEAVSRRHPIAADLTQMAALWPVFHERFVAETPFHSVASFPLRAGPDSYLGALDVYSSSPEALTSSELEEVDAAVAKPIASMLFRAPEDGEAKGVAVPDWLDRAEVNDRMNVWVAVGMAMGRLELTNTDALALLRGYAYSHELTLDEVARLMTDQRLRPEHLVAP